MSLIKVTDLLIELVNASEKAAQIARLCRAEEELFKLLVQEKSNDTKNPRFIRDFKTLADVLVQETVRHDLSRKFFGINDKIFGEENNKFENALGESVVVKIEESCNATSDLLLKVLDGNNKAADLLAKAVHSNQTQCLDQYLNQLIDENLNLELNLNDIGIWIDPIDSTSEYVNGVWDTLGNEKEGIMTSGLQCVTCLIGVYDSNTGSPLIGVANQPFFSPNNSYRELRYSGRYYWGFDINGIQRNNFSDKINPSLKGVVLIGGNEMQNIINSLKTNNKVIYAAGAGNKLLTIALGLADTYVNSQPSTFRWDTCSLHAILKSIGGGIVSFNDTIALKENILNRLAENQLNYLKNKNETNSLKMWSNLFGIIAYNNVDSLRATVMDLIISN